MKRVIFICFSTCSITLLNKILNVKVSTGYTSLELTVIVEVDNYIVANNHCLQTEASVCQLTCNNIS